MLRQVLCASVTATVASAVGDTLPVLPLSIAAAGSWTPPLPGGRYFGDTRAVIQLPSDYTGPTAAAQIFWRRRDPNPAIKEVVVVSSATGKVLPLVNATVESTCGLVYFSAPPGAGLYWAYYLPFVQNSGGASTTFTWGGCNSTDPTEANPCVLGRRASGGGASVCSVATSAATVVTGIEGRNSFDAFTDMEMMSAPAEATAAAAALQARLLGVDWRGGGSGPAVGNLALSPTPSLSVQASGAPFVGVFPTDRDHSVRVFDVTIPVRWVADAGTAPAFAGTAHAGEDYFFQLGLWAYAGGVANLTADGGAGLVGPAGATVPLTFMNLQGVDFMGSAFNKTMTLAAGAVGSLWVGAAVPAAAAPGTYAGVVTLSAPGAVAEIHVPVSLVVDSVTVPFGGAENITSLTRLSWCGRGSECFGAPLRDVAALLSSSSMPGSIPAAASKTRCRSPLWPCLLLEAARLGSP